MACSAITFFCISSVIAPPLAPSEGLAGLLASVWVEIMLVLCRVDDRGSEKGIVIIISYNPLIPTEGLDAAVLASVWVEIMLVLCRVDERGSEKGIVIIIFYNPLAPSEGLAVAVLASVCVEIMLVLCRVDDRGSDKGNCRNSTIPNVRFKTDNYGHQSIFFTAMPILLHQWE